MIRVVEDQKKSVSVLLGVCFCVREEFVCGEESKR